MKKLICIILVLTMALAFTACSESKKDKYDKACTLYEEGDYEKAMELLESIKDYEGASELLDNAKRGYVISELEKDYDFKKCLSFLENQDESLKESLYSEILKYIRYVEKNFSIAFQNGEDSFIYDARALCDFMGYTQRNESSVITLLSDNYTAIQKWLQSGDFLTKYHSSLLAVFQEINTSASMGKTDRFGSIAKEIEELTEDMKDFKNPSENTSLFISCINNMIEPLKEVQEKASSAEKQASFTKFLGYFNEYYDLLDKYNRECGKIIDEVNSILMKYDSME